MKILALVALIHAGVVLAKNGNGNGRQNGRRRHGNGNGHKQRDDNPIKEDAFTISSEEFHSTLPPAEQLSVIEPPQVEPLSPEEAPVKPTPIQQPPVEIRPASGPTDLPSVPNATKSKVQQLSIEIDPSQVEPLSSEEAPVKPTPIQQPSVEMRPASGPTDLPSVLNATKSNRDKNGVEKGLPAASVAIQSSPNYDHAASNFTIGIVVGSILGILALVFGVLIFKRRKSKNTLSVCSDATLGIYPTANFITEPKSNYTADDNSIFLQEVAEEQVYNEQTVISKIPDNFKYEHLSIGTIGAEIFDGIPKIETETLPDSLYSSDSGIQDLDVEIESFALSEDLYAPNHMSFYTEAPDLNHMSYYTAAPNTTYSMFLQEAAEEQVSIE